MKRCNKCLTPVSYPRTTFNHDGICNHCIDYEKSYSNWRESRKVRQEKFQNLINSAKNKSKKYDVLVPLSGGKDSTYVLFLATKKYKCKTLCYNFDNGFKSEIAQENIKSAIDTSGADLITFKPNDILLMRLYKHFLQHTGLFCPACMRGIYAGQFSITKQFNIPLVLKGSSQRTEEKLVPELFQDGRLSFFKNVLSKYPFDGDIRSFYTDRGVKEKLFRVFYILSNGKINLGTLDVQVPDYLDWDYHEIYKTISNEMGWKALPDRDEHVDCLADPTVHYLREIRCNDLTPNTLRYSAEIRSGQTDRSEALQLINEEIRNGINNEYIEYFLNKLHITRNDLETYMENNLRHMEYQRKEVIMSIFQKIRKIFTKII